MPVISAYSSSGSSYITSSRYPKSSYSDRKYYPSLSSGGLSSYSSSSSSVGGGGGSGYGSGLHYRKSSYRYDLVPTFSPCAYLSRAEDRNTGSTYRVAQPTTSHQQGAAALSNSGISVAPTSYEDSISNSASASNKNTISNSSSSSSNSSSSSSTTTTTTTTTTTSGIGTSSLSRSNRYSSTYGGYGSSSLNRDHSYTRGSTSASGSSNSPGGSNYVSNLRNSALCGAELYQRYSLSTFKPAPSIVSRATSGSEIGSSSTSSTLASLRGSSPVVSSLDNSSGSKATIKLRPAASSRSSTTAPSVVATTATITTVSNGGSGSASESSASVVVPGRSLKPAALATVSATTDDLRRAGESTGSDATGAKDGDYHVTATIRIKPRATSNSSSSSSTRISALSEPITTTVSNVVVIASRNGTGTTTTATGTSAGGSSGNSSSNNGSTCSSSNSLSFRHEEEEEGNQQNNNNSHANSNGVSDSHSRRASNGPLCLQSTGIRRGSNSNNTINNNNNGYSEPIENSSSSSSSSNGIESHNGATGNAPVDSARSLNAHEDLAGNDKLKANEDGRVNYQLRTGTSTKGLSSTSSYRSSKDYDSAYRVSSSGSGSSGPHKSSYDTDYDVTDSVRGRKEGLCGLWNIGNTCFMNSIIQCLSHTRELTTFLRSQSSIERGANKDHRILAEYTKLLKDMWSGTQRSVNPSELKYAFSSKHRMYSGSAQQDAQEFLRFFLDTLHGALNVAVKRDPLGDIDDDMNNRVKADLLWNWYSKAENSMIKDLFVGQLRSTLKCTYCGTESTMFDPFWDLSLPLPSSNSRCKLESCLEMFIKEEILDGIDQPTCSKCNTRRKCTKSLTIERFPKYLVIHLKRFSETRWSKLTNVIEFPTGDRELNLQPYASEDNMGPVNYSLYGISNHMGSTAGGHYIAVCKHPITKEWNEFNDNFVSETTERSLVTSSAYVLFYERA
ncbi:ubiquitin carboxyl-terminal hydrolase Usp2-like isoform X3 [Anopheles aquasalis]|uniref:ubiquitin carboxyl-terminal hydrolase Usp2-like isoform X3 n=1 Tax=Anopheles aquasalis TaxID=42839 RepID=UPI00215B415A|nr:ubiquitin carboxyl-terminal hydrolase Usp2-like isoform X3 [Anopheles aquasalis]